MSWQEWNDYYSKKGEEDFENGENHPPKDHCLVHPGAFDFDGSRTFTTNDAQSAYDAARSTAGAKAAEK